LDGNLIFLAVGLHPMDALVLVHELVEQCLLKQEAHREREFCYNMDIFAQILRLYYQTISYHIRSERNACM